MGSRLRDLVAELRMYSFTADRDTFSNEDCILFKCLNPFGCPQSEGYVRCLGFER